MTIGYLLQISYVVLILILLILPGVVDRDVDCGNGRDSLLTRWPSFLGEFCGYFCVNGSLYQPERNFPKNCTHPKCLPCDCDEYCLLRGTCCPPLTTASEKSPFRDNTSNSFYQDVRNYSYDDSFTTGLICETAGTNRTASVLTVVSCPRTWNDENAREKCEDPGDNSADLITPFTDSKTRLVYRNVFCATCNGFPLWSNTTNDSHDAPDGRFRQWRLEIQCLSYQNLFQLTDDFELYKAARRLEECNTKFVSPQNSENNCPDGFRSPSMEPSTCTPENRTLQELCHNLPDVPALRVTGYKNIFCYMCSGLELNGDVECFPERHSPISTPPIYLLFSTSGRRRRNERAQEVEITDCKEGQWRNDQGTCSSAKCPDGKAFDEDDDDNDDDADDDSGLCKSVIGHISGLTYHIDISLISDTPITILEFRNYVIAGIERTLQNKLVYDAVLLTYSIVTENSRFATFGYKDNSNTEEAQKELNEIGEENSQWNFTDKGTMVSINGSIIGSAYMYRDELEDKLLNLFISQPFNLVVLMSNYLRSVKLRTACIGRELCDLCCRDGSVSNNKTYNKDKDSSTKNSLIKTSGIEVRPDLICPSIAFNLSTEPIFVDGQFVFTITVRETPVNITGVQNVSLVNGQLLVCLDLLNTLSEKLELNSRPQRSVEDDDIIVIINYYSDIVCLFVSCVCLIISVMTYCIFPSLRSLPGLNNMSLCLTLLTAQLSLFVTSEFGSRGLLNKIHCLIHAFVLHYSWIASFFWTSVCCVHMFRVFTGRNFGSEKRKFVVYSVCAFGTPGLVVGLTVTGTFFATDGDSLGYDSDVCFLDTFTSNLILILGLLTPLCIAVVVNGVLFVLTVKEIVWVTGLQQTSRNHHGVMTYVKLSTVTGAFCFLVAAAIQLESPLLSLLSSPLAALQGVFIFMSFTANKRVWKLYKELLFGDGERDSLSSKTKSTSFSTNSTGTRDTPTRR